MSQQPVRVVVEKKPSGCGTWLAVMILLGLAIEYWYISLAIVAIVIPSRWSERRGNANSPATSRGRTIRG
jgi:hypothetical protein